MLHSSRLGMANGLTSAGFEAVPLVPLWKPIWEGGAVYGQSERGTTPLIAWRR